MIKHPLDEQVEAGLRGDFKRGMEIAHLLKRQNPNCRRAAFNRAWYEMMSGDLLEGLKLLDNGRWEKVFGDKPLPTSKPIWKDQDLTGKNLLLCSEGGLGDEIINVRFAADFAALGAKVTATCDPQLMSVFARVPGVSSVVAHKSAPHVYHDFWVPAMSAARVLNYTYDKLSGVPYFRHCEEHKITWAKKLREFNGGKIPRIGLRFYGNPEFEHEQFRRFPIDGLINAIGGRPWVNLQKEETSLPIKSWEDTLGILANLDLVITSCTSVAHASAALGKETWVILPILPYYIWALPGNRTPWYQSVRLFRQSTVREWDDVFANIAQALTDAGF